jgi:hypothetical protein
MYNSGGLRSLILGLPGKLGRQWITTQEALKTLIPDKWRNESPPSTSPSLNIIWHKHKAQKKMVFLRYVILKAVTVNVWHG